MNALHRPLLSRLLQHIVLLLPPLLIGTIFILGSVIFRHDSGPEVTPTAVPVVVVAAPTPLPERLPIRILNLDVEPDVLIVGGSGSLLNGICNDALEPITVKMYLGAQKLGGDPLMATVADLVGHNTPDGLVSRTIQPGCFAERPIEGAVDVRLTPGRWRLNLVVEAPGGRAMTKSSPVFEVRAAP